METKKKITLITLMILLALPFNTLADALVFGTFDNLPPYQYMKNGEWKGIEIEISRELARRLGVEIKYEGLPWKRMKKYAEEGRIDGVLSMFCLEKYLEILDFAESAITSKITVFAPKDSTIKITCLEDMKDKYVGVIRGYTYSSEFNSYKDIKRVESDDDKTLVRILKKGRVDMVVAEEMPFRFLSRQLGYENAFKQLYIITETKICMGFSKKALGAKSKILAENTTEIFRELKTEGVIQKILDKYI